MKLLLEIVVGYMYKVQKNQLDTSKYAKEFAAIRHGNYFQFFNEIEKEVDLIVTYENGQIKTNNKVKKNDVAFIALTKVGECLRDFYQRIFQTYGELKDPDMSDEDFQKAAYFELSIRMHSNDKRLPNEEIKFVDIIERLELTQSEKDTLHQGRKFINYIKRPWKMKNKWSDELERFNIAFELIKTKKLTII
ncbi:hypothetical protein ACFQ0R_11895 [Psychroflexus salinarum]|uniref:Antitoxin SocA-like Panacea domain-containing protein n=1 Tax=Psychroflexus salinarum TaxID=546024 RepID=A0ABW3GRW9_9FLAO